MTDIGTLDDFTLTRFSHVRPGDTGWSTGGLRAFFMYRDKLTLVKTGDCVTSARHCPRPVRLLARHGVSQK